MPKIIIGDPAQTGVSSHEAIKAAGLVEDAFPLTLVVENVSPRQLSLPEIKAYLQPGEAAKFTVPSLDVLLRAASSVQQIASLNAYPEAIALLLPGAPPEKAHKKGKPSADAEQ